MKSIFFLSIFLDLYIFAAAESPLFKICSEVPYAFSLTHTTCFSKNPADKLAHALLLVDKDIRDERVLQDTAHLMASVLSKREYNAVKGSQILDSVRQWHRLRDSTFLVQFFVLQDAVICQLPSKHQDLSDVQPTQGFSQVSFFFNSNKKEKDACSAFTVKDFYAPLLLYDIAKRGLSRSSYEATLNILYKKAHEILCPDIKVTISTDRIRQLLQKLW